MKDNRTTARLSCETRQRLQAAVPAGENREFNVTRDAMEMRLTAEQRTLTAYDRAKKARLIGAMKAKIRDLSTNPKYFDGFGDT